jgi:UDP-N-acetylmuramate--alanine ligase
VTLAVPLFGARRTTVAFGVSYGYNPQAQVRAVNVSHQNLNSTFTVISSGEELGEIQLKAPGDHNVKNALAAVAASAVA